MQAVGALSYGMACGLGAIAAVAFVALWRWIVPRGTGRRFWSSILKLTRQLVRVDDTREFLHIYGRLGSLAAGYLARSLYGTAVACLPMIAILLTVAPLVFAGWDGRAERLAVVPAAAGKIVNGADGLALRLKGADTMLPLASATERIGFCRSPDYCALFALLGFKVVELDPVRHSVPYAVVRPDHGNVNPFWPFLSDIEFVFFAAFALTTSVGQVWAGAQRA